MLIKALCDYYDMLEKSGKVLPDGYSKVKINCCVCLTPDGKIDEINDIQNTNLVRVGKDKLKEITTPIEMVMPRRTEKTCVDANIIEHRPLYLFGLNFDSGALNPKDPTDKAKKSHDAFTVKNLAFLEGLDSPVINAYRAFLLNWVPQEETENAYLLGLGKSYAKFNFVFCLSGYPHLLLHEDTQLKERWQAWYKQSLLGGGDSIIAQCAITGEDAPIARIHNKINGIYGGLGTGTVLVGFKNSCGTSYGNKYSYNSNVSERTMKKYTEALNYLLSSGKNKVLFDDITVVFWAMSDHEKYSNLVSALLFNNTDIMDAQQTQSMLQKLIKDAAEGNIVTGRIASTADIDPNVDFYVVGFKPNSSRISMKFMDRRKFGSLLANIAQHQSDMQLSEPVNPVPMWRMKQALVSQEIKHDTVNPALLSKLFGSIINGTNYPEFLLSTVVRRLKTDADKPVSSTSAGIIKACINRAFRLSNQKEELTLGLNKENRNPAYLCGRLFAVLEKLQQESAGVQLNRTIKDTYFASAAAQPAYIFPQLIKLSANHLGKVNRAVYFHKLQGEIINMLDGGFPETLSIVEQGKYMVGYFQQNAYFYTKKTVVEDNTQEEK